MTKNNLSVALLAGLAGTAGMVGVSDAVNINADGIGEALIYPYYTTRKDQITLMSVVNTTENTKAVKVRFLEGKASQEVLDFNVYMSPFDVWTATIRDNGTGAEIQTSDTTCTVPSVLNRGPVAFRNTEFDQIINGQAAPGEDTANDTSLDRTREGYIEILEMGAMDPTSEFGAPAVHVAQAEGPALPADWDGEECVTYEANWVSGGYWASVDPNTQDSTGTAMFEPQGGLFGGASVVDIAIGTIFSYNATALEAWRSAPIHRNPGDLFPSLADADPFSIVFDDGAVVDTDFSNGEDAVSSVIMHDAILNEYALDAVLLAQTDWVFTFPTKRFYVQNDGSPATQPFTEALTENGACEEITIEYYDREEQVPFTAPGDNDFSPRPDVPTITGPALCWEVSVFEWDDSEGTPAAGDGVLGSNLASNFVSEFQNGWGRVSFDDPANNLSGTDVGGVLTNTFEGLPVIGFSASRFLNNNAAPGVAANYTGVFGHRATRVITQS